MKRYVLPLLVAIASASPAAMADSIDAGNDWGSNWAFPSPARTTVGLLKADIIEKQENDYYEGLGKVNVNNNVNNTVNYDNRTGSFDTINASDGSAVDVSTQIGDNIGQNTNVIGAINNSNTSVSIEGSGNNVNTTNGADNRGCLSGGITTIDGSSPSTVGGFNCP
jgi:hypothetical protein